APIAAWLVELFPTRIRYSGLSLPYHIGNGWFGGFLPATGFAIVAATGDIYSGLWDPLVVAALHLLIGLLFLPETNGPDTTVHCRNTDTSPRGPSLTKCRAELRLWFGACRPFSVALISACDVERGQPILPPTSPELIGGCHLVRGIEGAGSDFDFIGRAAEERGSANWAEIASAIVGRRAGDADRIGRKHRISTQYRPVVLAAV